MKKFSKCGPPLQRDKIKRVRAEFALIAIDHSRIVKIIWKKKKINSEKHRNPSLS